LGSFDIPHLLPCPPLGCNGSPDPPQLFDSSLIPSESKDDALHPAPLAIVQLDLHLLDVEVEEQSELGQVQVYDLFLQGMLQGSGKY